MKKLGTTDHSPGLIKFFDRQNLSHSEEGKDTAFLCILLFWKGPQNFKVIYKNEKVKFCSSITHQHHVDFFSQGSCHNNGFFKVVATGSTGGGFQISETWLQILPSLFSPLPTKSNWELAHRLALVNKVRLTALYLLNNSEFMQQDGRKRRTATGLLNVCFVVLFTWH